MSTRAIAVLTALAGPMALVGHSTPAFAWGDGLYFGANLGKVLDSFQRPDIDSGVAGQFAGTTYTSGPSSVNHSHAMWVADLGYMVSPNIGIELSFLDLETLRYSGFGTVNSGTSGSNGVAVDLNIRTHGPALALVGVLPMSNWWQLDARAGAMQAKTSTSFSVTDSQGSNSGIQSKNTTTVLMGAGTGVFFTSHLSGRLDYTRLQRIDEAVVGRHFNVDLVTVGLQFMF